MLENNNTDLKNLTNDNNTLEFLAQYGLLDIGKIIKEIRKKFDLTQEDLAERVGTKRAYISRIEKDASNVRLSTLVKILEKGLDAKINVNIIAN